MDRVWDKGNICTYVCTYIYIKKKKVEVEMFLLCMKKKSIHRFHLDDVNIKECGSDSLFPSPFSIYQNQKSKSTL